MNEIEQRQIKMFCTIFVSALVIIVLLAAWSSFGLAFQ
jgi:hypothetical protein